MELRTRRLMLTLGGSLALSLGVLAACSDDSGFTALPGSTGTAVDAGKKASSSDSGDDGTGEEQDPDGGKATADCGAAPTPRDSSGVYCHKGEDGGALYCDPTEPTTAVCCDGAKKGSMYPASTCVASATSCVFPTGTDGGLPYACLQQKHCGDGSACCLTVGPKGAPKPRLDNTYGACGNYYFTDATGGFSAGTACKPGCDANELELCNTDADCSGGKSCKYLNLNSHDTGYCL